MANKKSKQGSSSQDEAAYQFQRAYHSVSTHPIFSRVMYHVRIHRAEKDNLCPRDGWAVVTNNGTIYVHPRLHAEQDEWIYVLIHCVLHLSFEHFQIREHQTAWNTACDLYIARFVQDLRLGKAPEEMQIRIDGLPRDEEGIYQRLIERGIPKEYTVCSTAGSGTGDMIIEDKPMPARYSWNGLPIKWAELFGEGLSAAVLGAVEYASGQTGSPELYSEYKNSPAQRAKR